MVVGRVASFHRRRSITCGIVSRLGHACNCYCHETVYPFLFFVSYFSLLFRHHNSTLSNRHPTMKKWTAKELLCNSRGLDDGYIFLHKDHPLGKETKFILNTGVEYTKNKFCVGDKDISRRSCFFGFLRKPLSHEIYDYDSNSMVPLPATASKISHTSDIFSTPIEPNEAICLAFTEPTLSSHRSVILRGAVPPPSILTDEDRRIRRPRLNRGEDTIANLGGGNSSHKSGYGSMNINSYERELAKKTGRERQMNQAGTRAWGAMEPTPKRHQGANQTVVPWVPLQRWQAPPSVTQPSHVQQPPQQHNSTSSQRWQPPLAPTSVPQQYQHGMQQAAYASNPGAYNQLTMTAMAGNNENRTVQQQWRGNSMHPNQSNYQQQQRSYQHQNPILPQNLGYTPSYQGNQLQNQCQSGFVFNQQGQQRQMPLHQQQQQTQSSFSFNRQGMQQQSNQQRQTVSRANLSNLRAQLMSTLQQNRRNKGN